VQPGKIFAMSIRWLAAIGMATVTTQPSVADVLYTYQTSIRNLLYNTENSEPDYFTITFLSPFVLAPDSYYNISVSNSASYIGSWSASDSLFGIYLTGSNAPISLVPAPALMAGGALTYCEITMLSCFGGAIATNAAGQIDQWNLVADGAYDQPYLTFITYNNPFIGTVDALGSTQNGEDVLWENQLGGPAGSWNGFMPSSYPPGPGPVPESSTWAMTLIGFAGLGFVGYRRAAGPRGAT
jgi:hypothetical protein